jgi:surfactin synthase thioesterase subunit
MGIEPLILYVPGLRPKPPPATHRNELLRSMVEGIRRIDGEVALQIRETDRAFDIVGWTYDFYGEHRDVELDRTAIEQVLRQPAATPKDIEEASTLKRRAVRWLYRAAEHLPFLIPQVADENMQLHLRDLRRYVTNDADIANATRRQLKMPLRAAWKSGRPILLIGHSMGSVIAYDTLWQMSRESKEEVRVDLLTLGSPLGQRYIQRRLAGCSEVGERRYPDNIKLWVNIAAVGEMTAVDTAVRNDFSDMIALGLIEDIRDIEVYNYFRFHGVLNVHSEYGYLVNEATAREIRNWWRSVTGSAEESVTPSSTRAEAPWFRARQDRGSA